MSESIGTRQFGIIRPSDGAYSPLKMEALYFDGLVVTKHFIESLLATRNAIARDTGRYLGRDEKALSALLDNGVLVFADNLLGRELGPEFVFDSPEGRQLLQKDGLSTGEDTADVEPDISDKELHSVLAGYCRTLSCALADKGIRASSIYPTIGSFESEYNAADVPCLAVVLRSLPLPGKEVPWKQIIEFRNDPDSQKKLRALRDWQNDIAQEGLADYAIADKLAHLVDDYTEHMKLHKLKYETGKAEIILRIGVEMLEGLLRLKPTKVVDALFSFGKRSLDLKDAELRAPGREVAFIHKARETFG